MDFDEYLRIEAAKYRALAEEVGDLRAKEELLELSSVCEEVANQVEDQMTAG